MDFKYFPYFRGKQFELLALREYATWKQGQGKPKTIAPVIEPVRSNTSNLGRALEELTKAGCLSQVVVNPACGDFKGEYLDFMEDYFTNTSIGGSGGSSLVVPAVIASDENESFPWRDALQALSTTELTLIHDGTAEIASLQAEIKKFSRITHIFWKDGLTVYAKRFGLESGHSHPAERFVRLVDGFKVEPRNVDYRDKDLFSENHLTYSSDGYDGFGDFLTIGDNYSETGGPARAVAIHITYIDESELGRMYCQHFLSDTNDSPDDPGNKFLEAVGKLDRTVSSSPKFLIAPAIEEFIRFYKERHFPGLGYVKKLSMLHHLFLLDSFV